MLSWYIGQIVFSTCRSISLCRRYNADYFHSWKMTALLAECKVEIEIPLPPPLQKGDVSEFIQTSSPFDKGGLGGILILIRP